MKIIIDEKLDKNLNIAPSAKKKPITTVVDVKPVVATFPPDQPRRVSNSSDTIEDYKKSRTELKRVLELGGNALEEILIIAAQSEQPRAYEVAGQLIKNLTEASDRLLRVQREIRDIEEKDDPNIIAAKQGPKEVHNTLILQSTTELQKIIDKQMGELPRIHDDSTTNE